MDLVTVVAAIAREGRIVMAADRATNYQGTGILGARKIARIGSGPDTMLLAASGSGSLLSLHRHWQVDSFPEPTAPNDVQAWADACATALTELAANTDPPLIEDGSLPGAFLLGWRGRLIYVFAHQATVVPDGIAALGNGCDYALGYLEAAVRLTSSRDDQVLAEMAVMGACEGFDGCRLGGRGPLVESIG